MSLSAWPLATLLHSQAPPGLWRCTRCEPRRMSRAHTRALALTRNHERLADGMQEHRPTSETTTSQEYQWAHWAVYCTSAHPVSLDGPGSPGRAHATARRTRRPRRRRKERGKGRQRETRRLPGLCDGRSLIHRRWSIWQYRRMTRWKDCTPSPGPGRWAEQQSHRWDGSGVCSKETPGLHARQLVTTTRAAQIHASRFRPRTLNERHPRSCTS